MEKELKKELIDISKELAASIKRELDLEYLVEQLQAEKQEFQETLLVRFSILAYYISSILQYNKDSIH